MIWNAPIIRSAIAVITVLLATSASTRLGWTAIPENSRATDRSAAHADIQPSSLEHELAHRIGRVREIAFLKTEAARLGIRAWLFGGTAASYAHYVRADFLREQGDSRFQKDRFDYDYTNIFRSTQDFDIVVDTLDGQIDPQLAEKAQELQNRLSAAFPHLQGTKTAWEVRTLRTTVGKKEAILDNPSFQDQHTDSHSTGLIEITKTPAGEPPVRDARDWHNPRSAFFEDVRLAKLHYYFSAKHTLTKRYLEGLNPPIFSALRYLTKAFQYELEIKAEDWSRIRKIALDFDPSRDLTTPYARDWLQRNGKKLLQHAVNLEYAVKMLDELGLRERLRGMGNIEKIDSLSWWMSKEPLRSRELPRAGEAPGAPTAADLGITTVAHETNSMLAYESITRAPTGDPNVLISRKDQPGENALHGDGFYTRRGREGARGSGLTIRFEVVPSAVLGRDFEIHQDFVIFKNKRALRVITESLKLDPVQYFELLAAGFAGTHPGDRALLEKFKRKLDIQAHATSAGEGLSADQLSAMDRIAEAQLQAPHHNDSFWKEWLASPVAWRDPRWPARIIEAFPDQWEIRDQIEAGQTHAEKAWQELLDLPGNSESKARLEAAKKQAILSISVGTRAPGFSSLSFWKEWAKYPESVTLLDEIQKMIELEEHPASAIANVVQALSNQPHWQEFWGSKKFLDHPFGQVLSLGRRTLSDLEQVESTWKLAANRQLVERAPGPSLLYRLYAKTIRDEIPFFSGLSSRVASQEIWWRLNQEKDKFSPDYFSLPLHRGEAWIALRILFQSRLSPWEKQPLGRALLAAAPELFDEYIQAIPVKSKRRFDEIIPFDREYQFFLHVFAKDPLRAIQMLAESGASEKTEDGAGWMKNALRLAYEDNRPRTVELLKDGPLAANLLNGKTMTSLGSKLDGPSAAALSPLIKMLPNTPRIREMVDRALTSDRGMTATGLWAMLNHVLTLPQFRDSPDLRKWLGHLVNWAERVDSWWITRDIAKYATSQAALHPSVPLSDPQLGALEDLARRQPPPKSKDLAHWKLARKTISEITPRSDREKLVFAAFAIEDHDARVQALETGLAKLQPRGVESPVTCLGAELKWGI